MSDCVSAAVRRNAPRLRLLALALALVPGVALAQSPTAEETIAATVAEIDRAVQALDVEALGRILAPEFTESTQGCGPEKPRNSRRQYLDTFAGVARTRPTSYRRERGPLEIKLLGSGEIGVVRSSVTDRVEWSSGTLTGTSREALFLTRVGSTYKATSLDAHLACTDMQLVGSMPPAPGG